MMQHMSSADNLRRTGDHARALRRNGWIVDECWGGLLKFGRRKGWGALAVGDRGVAWVLFFGGALGMPRRYSRPWDSIASWRVENRFIWITFNGALPDGRARTDPPLAWFSAEPAFWTAWELNVPSHRGSYQFLTDAARARLGSSGWSDRGRWVREILA